MADDLRHEHRGHPGVERIDLEPVLNEFDQILDLIAFDDAGPASGSSGAMGLALACALTVRSVRHTHSEATEPDVRDQAWQIAEDAGRTWRRMLELAAADANLYAEARPFLTAFYRSGSATPELRSLYNNLETSLEEILEWSAVVATRAADAAAIASRGSEWTNDRPSRERVAAVCAGLLAVSVARMMGYLIATSDHELLAAIKDDAESRQQRLRKVASFVEATTALAREWLPPGLPDSLS